MLETVAPWIVVTGLDGSGKTSLVHRLAQRLSAHWFKLPYHDFVREGLRRSGDGSQFGDVHTDRLLMAADARLTHYRIRDWRRAHKFVVSQRAWMDNFVFAAVQGCSWAETDALLCTAELERPSVAIFLIAEPEIGYQRICHDPEGDKFETLDFMRVQHQETLRLYRGFQESHPELAAFREIPAHLIDTSHLDKEAVFDAALAFLQERNLA